VPVVPASLDTGLPGRPFDLSRAIEEVVLDVRVKCPEFAHVDLNRMMIGILRAKTTERTGLIARVTPLRCENGSMVTRKRGRLYTVQQFRHESRDLLYLMSFCLPRFLDRPYGDKLITIFHELFHISPAFDGDFRRLGGRCEVHSGSKKNYDAHMAVLVKHYLKNGADLAKLAFLNLNFIQLCKRHGSVLGYHFPRPVLIPVSS
jgi:predicted metallopeptidase